MLVIVMSYRSSTYFLATNHPLFSYSSLNLTSDQRLCMAQREVVGNSSWKTGQRYDSAGRKEHIRNIRKPGVAISVSDSLISTSPGRTAVNQRRRQRCNVAIVTGSKTRLTESARGRFPLNHTSGPRFAGYEGHADPLKCWPVWRSGSAFLS
jgi:hypothetical protein